MKNKERPFYVVHQELLTAKVSIEHYHKQLYYHSDISDANAGLPLLKARQKLLKLEREFAELQVEYRTILGRSYVYEPEHYADGAQSA